MNDTVRKAERIYQEGLALMEYKYYANALSCFEQAIDLTPNFAQAWFQIGHCRSELVQREIENTEEYLYTEDVFEGYQGTIEAYQKAIELQPDYADARNSLAELFYDFGERQSEGAEWPSHYMQAIEWYEQAAEVSGDWGTAYHQIGQEYRYLIESCEDDEIRDSIDFDGTLGIAEKYIKTYQQLIQIQPDDARAYYELGEAYTIWIYPFITMEENYGDETSDEIEAMKQDKHPQIQGVLKKAIKVYRTAVRIKSDYGEAYYQLAKACHRVARFEEAIQAFKQAIVLDVKDYFSTPHRNLAEAYHGLGKQNFVDGNYIQAIECYHSAMMADSSYDGVHYDLAVANDEARRYELALLWYERSAPSYTKIVKPNYEPTMRWYRDIRCSYHYLNLYYRTGKVCHRLGRYQNAVEAYEKAIDLQIAIVDAYNEACFEVETKAFNIEKENERQYFLQYRMPEPPEYPEWWDHVFGNKELACCHQPLPGPKNIETQTKILA